MKCPNELCGGKVEEFVRTNGQGSRYCLDGCGYYEEFQGTPPPKRRHERGERVAPMKRPALRRRD